MSDYLKGKRVVDPVLTSIARGYKNALTDEHGIKSFSFIGPSFL